MQNVPQQRPAPPLPPGRQPPIGLRPAPPPVPEQREDIVITPTEREAPIFKQEPRVSSVKNRAAFFESVGQEIGGPVPANVSQIIQQREGSLQPVTPTEVEDTVESFTTTTATTVISDETRLVSHNFTAMEAWQLGVTAGDIVQLSNEVVPQGWISCILITKDHPSYGRRGCVPASYLVQVRANKLTETLPSNYVAPAIPAKKYKPVAKNLKMKSKKSWF